MGGCVSRPKDLDTKQQPLIAEEATTPTKAEGETVPQEDNGGETKTEEPLVDVSEPGQEAEEPAAEEKPEEEAAGEAKEEEKIEEDKEKPEEPAAPTVDDKTDAPLVTL